FHDDLVLYRDVGRDPTRGAAEEHVLGGENGRVPGDRCQLAVGFGRALLVDGHHAASDELAERDHGQIPWPGSRFDGGHQLGGHAEQVGQAVALPGDLLGRQLLDGGGEVAGGGEVHLLV